MPKARDTTTLHSLPCAAPAIYKPLPVCAKLGERVDTPSIGNGITYRTGLHHRRLSGQHVAIGSIKINGTVVGLPERCGTLLGLSVTPMYVYALQAKARSWTHGC